MRPRTFSIVELGLMLLIGAIGGASGASSQTGFSLPDTSTAADSVVTFNELLYHPGGSSPSVEWVELYNATSLDMELSGWRIEGGIEYRFPTNTILSSGGFAVVASNPSILQAATGLTNVYGPFVGQLANEGETLRLRNHNDRILDEVTYGDQVPWPVASDGSGASLAKLHPQDASSPAANWRASTQIGGTPGRANFPETDSAEPKPVDWVAPSSPGRWRIPDDTVFRQNWKLPDFDDSSWAQATASVGFDRGAGSSSAPGASSAYDFDGDVTDASGNGYDGQNLGAQFSTNVPAAIGAGRSAQFDGLTSQVRVSAPNNPPAYTLCLWVSVDTVRPSSLLVRTDASGPRVNWSHQLRINSLGQFEHYLWDGSMRSVAATNVIQPGVWYHLAATASNNGAMRLYVNGISSDAGTTIGTLWAGGNQWQFGTDSGQTPNSFRGRLDEAGIWAEVLDPADIARLAAGISPTLLNGYHNLIGTDLQSSLLGVSGSLLLRLPFNLPAGMTYDQPTLTVRYDDGFVAYLNGTEVARRNAPQTLAWNSTSSIKRTSGAAYHGETFDLSPWVSSLATGRNVLTFQALNASASDTNLLLTAQLSAIEKPTAPEQTDLSFSELAAAQSSAFFVEIFNHGTSNLSLAGLTLQSSAGPKFTLGAGSLSPGQFLALGTNQLGFPVQSGDKLFLLGKALNVIDGVKVSDRLQGRLPSDPAGPWFYPVAPTPGATNEFSLHKEIVINEILYHHAPSYSTNTSPPTMVQDDEQWIELYNRSLTAVDLSGWRLADAVTYIFPGNTVLAADAYLVIANNAAALRRRYPDLPALGDFKGQLPHRGGRVSLIDAQGNPANAVTYYSGFPWPEYPDGGGSSLELRDPRADNSVPESWAASLEGEKATWRHYSYRARAINPVYSPNLYNFNELRLGLLAPGEVLLDNLAVLELATNAPPKQLLQNTNFSNGSAHWRLVGNHVHSRVESDAAAPANPALHLVATGPMTYLENQLETTLKANGVSVPVVAGREYEIDFDAKWVAGSPQLHTELYYNRVATTTILDRPALEGTPGRRNSTFVTNSGPTWAGLRHAPVLPLSTNTITVSVNAADPYGISGVRLYYAVDGGAWRSSVMDASAGSLGSYTGTIPAQAAGSVIQFYVQGTDSLGTTTTYPASGANSRALIKVDVPQLMADKQTLRTILTPSDSALLHSFVNLMSDDLLHCTVIHNEKEVFYDARIRLHGSMFSRPDASTAGLRVEFPRDHLFRGVRPAVVVRRSNLVESLGHLILNQAGGLPASYCDIVHLVSHRPDNVGTATLQLADLDSSYVDSQFEGNNDGTLFKLEGIRVYESTDDGTPEGYKLPQPVDFVWDYDLTNLGDNLEQYRWSVLILNQRARDDYSRIVAMGKAFSQTGSALQQAVSAVIDVDEWARYFALQNLLGIADIFGTDNPHNIAFYSRPNDGRLLVLQNDWGYAYVSPADASIYGRHKIYEILNLPAYRRLYQGHLLDLINSTCNRAHLSRWVQHLSRVTGMDLSGALAYADARSAAVRTQLAQKTAFTIASNGGKDFSVDTPVVTLQGYGWIDVHDIGLGSRTNLLPISWLDDQQWQLTVPLQAGTNRLQLLAYDYRGAIVGQAGIQVTTTVSGLPQREYLRITELMYHPAPPTDAEVAAGFTSEEDFEFIELLNTGPTNLSLLGVRFTAGITFDFTSAAITNLAAGQRVLVVGRKSAFAFRYGHLPNVAGAFSGHLNNSGELLRLVDAWGNVIQELNYHADGGWPTAADGLGYSLELLDANADSGSASNWQASLGLGGTPGRPPVIRPAFSGIWLQGMQIRLQFKATAELTYTLESRASLATGNWQLLATIPAGGTSRVEEVVDTMPTAGAMRFYRLSTP